MRFRSLVGLGVFALALSGCGGALSSSPQAGAAPATRPASTGNIFWSKAHIRLTYPAHGVKQVVLTYWGPDGYFTYPMDCQNGSTIAISHGKAHGNPSGYQHVIYSFRAENAGPDTCSYDAVLNNTGSPPITVLKLTIAP